MHRCAAVCFALALMPSLCSAQAVQRTFTARTLRGELLVTLPPEVRLNGELARLSPGARIKGVNNLLLMSGALVGQVLLVNYTLDSYGLVHEVWLLSDEERARQPWPTRRDEAERWSFDAAAQTWTRR